MTDKKELEAMQIIHEALDSLPDDTAQARVLEYFADYFVGSTAFMRKCTLDKVEALISKALGVGSDGPL